MTNINSTPGDTTTASPTPETAPNLVADAAQPTAVDTATAQVNAPTVEISEGVVPDTTTMKAYLTGKDATITFDGKTDAEIKGLFDTAKIKETEGTTTDADKDKKPDVPKAPEKYADFKIAEGIAIPDSLRSQVETMAKELDLPQDKAQKLFDLAPEISKMYNSQLYEAAAKASKDWHSESIADKEIGGGGDKKILDTNMADVAKARDAFATPELKKLLEPFHKDTNPSGTGFGNHPEVVRLLMRIGKAMGQDGKFINGGGNSESLTAADQLYKKTK